MNEALSFSESIALAMQRLWLEVGAWLPKFIAGIVILVIGYIVAIILGKIANWIVGAARIDLLLAKTPIPGFFQRAGWRFRIDVIFEKTVRWFFFIAFFIVAMDTMGLSQVSDFLRVVLAYIPNIVIAAIIGAIGLFVGNFAYDAVRGTSAAAGSAHPALLASVSRYAIFGLTAVTVLDQLRIGGWLLTSLVGSIGLGIAIAFGIAFGWGGKDIATDLLQKVRRDVGGGKK